MDIGNRLKNYVRSVVSLISRERRKVSPLYEAGFHGDTYLMAIAQHLLDQSSCFVETGANVGSTLAYVARNYPHVRSLSCEPDQEAYREAKKNVAGFPNAEVFNETSQQFIERLREENTLLDKTGVFWLDAHGYGFEWPLKEEIEFITHNFDRGYIFIDDFLVPGQDQFKFDEYKGQVCSFEQIKSALKNELQYSLYYPNYTEKTSPHHSLTGWGLIAFGNTRDFELPESLANKVKKAL